ncbi:hypothetical protein HDU87_000135 [Geranomyces variabilis]|uniref:WW domain-containing protein n=1 Tax=Geranomyces variabilis TaxID=109894 RepID=A0AAD5TSD5_9FUNG|nr:hypothetical protein HDU87_000135 [Geranomyces variabilis]
MEPPGDQVVLEEEFDENYEPTDEEIVDYAKFLGIDPDTEPDLLWIARQSLKAPLPPNWKPCQTADGKIYYFNFTTGESIWDHPCDEHYKRLYAEEKAKSVAARAAGSGSASGKGKEKGLSRGGISSSSSAAKQPGADKANQPQHELLTPLLPTLNTKPKLAALPTIAPLSKNNNKLGKLGALDMETSTTRPMSIPRVDSEDEISLPRAGDKDVHDWDALSDDDEDEDDARIIDSVLKGKDPARNLNGTNAGAGASKAGGAQQQQQQTQLEPLGERQLKQIHEDDDFELSLSSDRSIDRQPQPLQQQQQPTRDRLEAEEKRIFDTAAKEIRAKYDAELRAFQQAESEKLETEKNKLRALYADKKQQTEQDEQERFAIAVSALRAKYKQRLADEETAEKRELDRALGEMKRANADKLSALKREEEAALERDIETAKHRHEAKLADVVDSFSEQLEQRKMSESDALDRAVRDLRRENAEKLSAARVRETDLHDREVRDMRRAFESQRANLEREHRDALDAAEREFRDRLEHTVDERAIADVVGRAEDEHSRRLAKLKQKQADAEKDAKADLERQSAAKLRALKDELDAKEAAQRKQSEARFKEHEAKETALKQQLDVKLRELERDLAAKEAAKRKELDARSRDLQADAMQSTADDGDDTTRRAASLNARKAKLDQLERELDEREDALRSRAREQRRNDRDDEEPISERKHRHHHHKHDDRSARHRSSSRSSRSPKRVQLHEDEGQMPRSMLRGLAAEVLSAAGLDNTALTEDLDDGEEDPLRYLYTNTNADSDSDQDDDEIDLLSRATQDRRSNFRRSQSPSTLLASRLRSEEAQIQQAKQYLRRQQKNIGARQKELSLAQRKWKKEIAEISSHLQRGGIPLPSQKRAQQQGVDSLDEIEGELGKLLGALKASISSNRMDDDARIAMSQRATSLR